MRQVWGIKHRPTTIDDYVFQNADFKQKIVEMIESKQLPHLLFSGVQGTGKTSLARILINSMNVDPDLDVKIIDASKQNSVDDMRDEIMDFITSYPMGDFKIVLMEEADYLSLAAQAVLRTPLEDPEISARFIFTCNYDHKIIPPIKSRLQCYKFKAPNFDDVIMRVATVLTDEKVKFDLPTLEKYVSASYPDIRQILNSIEPNCSQGVLRDVSLDKQDADYKLELGELLGNDQWEDARLLVCKNVTDQEWEDVYRYLYDNLHNFGKFKKREKYEQGIITIAEHLYKHSICTDAEINAAAMFIKMSTV